MSLKSREQDLTETNNDKKQKLFVIKTTKFQMLLIWMLTCKEFHRAGAESVKKFFHISQMFSCSGKLRG